MNLDDLAHMRQLDSQGMLGFIDRLPDQLQQAWQAASAFPLDPPPQPIRNILVAGMGGSGIGGALLAALCEHTAAVPVSVWRNYGLPAWAQGRETRVIVASHRQHGRVVRI
jgi:glucose/mannose-6-phosphate isomerase